MNNDYALKYMIQTCVNASECTIRDTQESSIKRHILSASMSAIVFLVSETFLVNIFLFWTLPPLKKR